MKRDRLTELYAAKTEGDVPLLIEGLRDAEHRFIAAHHLGDLRAKEAVQPLIMLLRAGDTARRSSAASALGKIGAKEAVPALIDLARADESVVAQTHGITALGAVGDERALEPLCQLLHNEDIVVR